MKRLAFLFIVLAGCADNPVYFQPTPGEVEINLPNMGTGAAMARVIIPMRLDTLDETMKREELAMELGLTVDQIPQIKRGDLDVAIEWTVKNLDDQDGHATIAVVGANEYFSYDPQAFVIDPEEDEPPPPLLGGKPIDVEPLGVTNGVLREDEVAEASQDLDAITRWGIAPEYATLTRWPTDDITDQVDMTTVLLAGKAVPAMLQFDVSFTGNTHMVLEYVVRVRDHSDRLRPTETDQSLLVQPSVTSYAPPPPMLP